MIQQLRDALLEGYQIKFRPYVGRVLIILTIVRHDNLYEFNKLSDIDEKSIDDAIAYIKSEIKNVMQ